MKKILLSMAVVVLLASPGWAQKDPDTDKEKAAMCREIQAGNYQEVPLLTLQEAGYTLKQAENMYYLADHPFDEASYETAKVIWETGAEDAQGKPLRYIRITLNQNGRDVFRFYDLYHDTNQDRINSGSVGSNRSTDYGLRSHKFIQLGGRYFLAWASPDAQGHERIDRAGTAVLNDSKINKFNSWVFCDFAK